MLGSLVQGLWTDTAFRLHTARVPLITGSLVYGVARPTLVRITRVDFLWFSHRSLTLGPLRQLNFLVQGLLV